MTPERQRRAHARAQDMLAPLRELRQARRLTQEALARELRSKQALVSKLERRADMYVSSLRSYIEAMGGELDIIARFPDGLCVSGSLGTSAAASTRSNGMSISND